MQSAFVVAGQLQIHMNGVRGEKGGRLLGPFHQAGGATVQGLFHTGPEGFLLAVQPVEIHMVQNAFRTMIFIDQRERGARHFIGDSQKPAKGMDKSGFTGPHGSMKGQHATFSGLLPKQGGNSIYFAEREYLIHATKINSRPLPRAFCNSVELLFLYW